MLGAAWGRAEMFDNRMAIRAGDAGDRVEQEMAGRIGGQPEARLVQPRELGAVAAWWCGEGALGSTGDDGQLNAGGLW